MLRKWLISGKLDSKLQPLRVGVVEGPSGKTVGRVTVQEGDEIDSASEAMLQARRYVCDSEGSDTLAMAWPAGCRHRLVPAECRLAGEVEHKERTFGFESSAKAPT